MPTVDPTGPPADLDAKGRNLYRKLRGYLKDWGSWHPADAEYLGTTVRWAQRARLARAGMADEDGRPVLTTTGYKGQPVQHPNLKTANEAERAYGEGLRELGFTARARKQLEIDAGGPPAGGVFGGAFD